jgi:hypothetical protein
MNRIFNLCLVLMILVSANSAFASRARQQVMGSADPFGVVGSANHGSLYFDDNYNVFYNPSYANDWKNWVTIEKFNGTGSATTPGSAQAEGGFIASMMNFSVGAFFNRGDAMKGTYQNTAVPTNYSGDLRPIDVIIAGDMGVKWGLGLNYGNYKLGNDQSASELNANLGLQIAGFEPFLNMMIVGKDTLTAGQTQKNTNFTIGTKYKWGEWVPFAAFQTRRNFATTATFGEQHTTNWGVGLGRNTKFGEATSFNYAVSFWRQKNYVSDGSRTIVPINVSIESEFASWLIGRAGVTYNLIDRTSSGVPNTDATSTALTAGGNPPATTGRIGATFRFNKVDVDWAVGSTVGTENPDGQTFDFANGLFSTASLTYRW